MESSDAARQTAKGVGARISTNPHPGRAQTPASTTHSTWSHIMNKDQVKGTLKDAAGKLQEKTGQVIGSTEQQVKGINKQVEGQTQKAVGDVKEVLKDLRHK
jgi:uncharacterized protein YjbJ (UPF0337 family)